jgi:hypothetical protein
LLLVAVAAALLSLISLGNNHGVAALSFPIPVIAAPEPAPYDLDQEAEHRANSKQGETYRLGEEEVTKLKQRILAGLGLTRTPDASKVSEALLQHGDPAHWNSRSSLIFDVSWSPTWV